MTDLNRVHSPVLLASATSSDTKLLAVFISVAGTTLFLLAGRWLVDWYGERRMRALIREHPELSIPILDGAPQVADDSRSWFVRQRDAWVEACELAPRPNLTATRMVLPTLLALVGVLIAALIVQAASHSPIAGWVAFIGMFVLLLYGIAALAPSRGDRARARLRTRPSRRARRAACAVHGDRKLEADLELVRAAEATRVLDPPRDAEAVPESCQAQRRAPKTVV